MSTENQNIVDQIVEKCAGSLSIFLGAGASKAVGLPDMNSFWQQAYGEDFVKGIGDVANYQIANKQPLTQAQSEINKTSAIRRLIQTACLGTGKISSDLEIIYDYIHHNPILSAGRGNIENLKKLFYFYHNAAQGGNNWNFDQYKKQFNPFRQSFTTWIEDMYECVENLRKEVNGAYLITRGDNRLEKAEHCYRFLPHLEQPSVIFTTNYDTVFEALDESSKLNKMGLTLQNGCKPQDKYHNYFAVENYTTNVGNPLYLFHLHGSVAWKYQEQNVEDYYPHGHREKSAIVEPVISKKLPKIPPFNSMYEIFIKTLRQNSGLLVIGFSFRDEEIKKIVLETLESNKSFFVVCVAPPNADSEMDRHIVELADKYTDRFIWLKNYFGEQETENLILETIQERIGKTR
ncbi:hypothetical protein FACS189443_1680 [Planctomycetales bacterium]|nr:hypothetical protein FACS189443_1680 [Planctomycetales bacterium]